MDLTALTKVVRDSARKLGEVEDEESGYSKFPDETELLNVLARLLEGKEVMRAFGAPGDWGYDTPIGKAIADIYRKAREPKL